VAGDAFCLFAEVAARQPERPALDDGQIRLTYRQALALANGLAVRLARGTARGGAAPPSGPVALLLPNGAFHPVATLACLRAGRAALALDLRHPAQRNAELLVEAGISAVVYDGQVGTGDLSPEHLPAQRLDVRGILAEAGQDPAFDALPGAASLAPEDPAFILCTSGSTGRPQAFAHSQSDMLLRAAQMIEAYHLNPSDRYLSLASPSAVAGLMDALAALLSGACLMKPDLQRVGLGEVLRMAREGGATLLYAPPALWRSLLRLEQAPAALATLRAVRSSGEPLLPPDLVLLRQRLPPGCLILSGYGATESPAVLQWFVPPHFDAASAVRIPAGYPMAGHEFAIVGEDGRPLPAGVIGELVVRSRLNALGLWRDGRIISDAHLRPDPQDASRRILHTGDLARMRSEDGLVEIIGRQDRQLKVRGQRVEPSEIETALRRLPQVLDAAVVARPGPHQGEAALVAFVVRHRGLTAVDAVPLAGIARAALREILPGYMQPSRIRVVDAIPRLPGGKLDAEALSAADDREARTIPANRVGSGEPDGMLAKAVATAWLEVLDRRSLAEDETFDAAGGDSLRLLQLAFTLEASLGCRLPLDLFHQAMRPSEIAETLERHLEASRSPPPEAQDDPRPLAFMMTGQGDDEPVVAQLRGECAAAVRFAVPRYPNWRRLAEPAFGFDALVADVAAQIADRQPTDALRLIGYSFGGAIAFGAAAELVRAGREIALLCILDTRAPGQRETPPVGLVNEVRWQVRRVLRGDGVHSLADILARNMVWRPWLRPLPRQAARRPGFPVGGRLGFLLQRELSMRMQMAALATWRARPEKGMRLPLRIVLFRSEEHAPDEPEDLGWGAFCEAVEVLHVTGLHSTILNQPHRDGLRPKLLQVVARSADAPDDVLV
jgi:acyl-coenzyme A synthetase/AMP-(fatty) acid ligase/thioesterase domain-containing protein/acyl carrier protein